MAAGARRRLHGLGRIPESCFSSKYLKLSPTRGVRVRRGIKRGFGSVEAEAAGLAGECREIDSLLRKLPGPMTGIVIDTQVIRIKIGALAARIKRAAGKRSRVIRRARPYFLKFNPANPGKSLQFNPAELSASRSLGMVRQASKSLESASEALTKIAEQRNQKR